MVKMYILRQKNPSNKFSIHLSMLEKKLRKNTQPLSSVNAVMSVWSLFLCVECVESLCVKCVGPLCAVIMLASLDDMGTGMDWQDPWITIEASGRLIVWNYKIIDNVKWHVVNIINT